MHPLAAQDVPQSSRCQQPRRMMRFLHVGHRHRGVAHPVVHDGVDADGDGVFGQDLAMTKVAIPWGPSMRDYRSGFRQVSGFFFIKKKKKKMKKNIRIKNSEIRRKSTGNPPETRRRFPAGFQVIHY